MLLHIVLYMLFVMVPILLSSRVFIGLLAKWWNRYGYVPGMLIITIIPTAIFFLVTVKLTDLWFHAEEHNHTLLLAIAALVSGVVLAFDAASRSAKKNSNIKS